MPYFNNSIDKWFIYYRIPKSNTRWENPRYFPLLRTLPRPNQISKMGQSYLYDGIVKKASNYKHNYFDSFNSVYIEDLDKITVKK